MIEWVGADEAQKLLDGAASGPWDGRPSDGWVGYEVINKDGRLAKVLSHHLPDRALGNAQLMVAAPRLAATVIRLSEELAITWEAIELVISKLDKKTAGAMLAVIDEVRAEGMEPADAN